MKYHYTVHKEERAYDGFFKLNRLHVSFERFDGGMIKNVIRECSDKGDVVAVLPYDPVRQVFLMVEQFRIGMAIRKTHPWTMEIVAGFMDVAGEKPEETAARELTEETGCQAKSIQPLVDYYPSPGGSGAKIHVFLAKVDATQATKHTGITEEGEDIYVHHLPLALMKEKTYAGNLSNATTMIAFQHFFLNNWESKLTG